MAIVGSTIKIHAEFKSFDGVYTTPSDAVLKIYDEHRQQVGDTITILPEHIISDGVIEVPYVLPDTDPYGIITKYCEMSGTIGGLPVVGRIMLNWQYVQGGQNDGTT